MVLQLERYFKYTYIDNKGINAQNLHAGQSLPSRQLEFHRSFSCPGDSAGSTWSPSTILRKTNLDLGKMSNKKRNCSPEMDPPDSVLGTEP